MYMASTLCIKYDYQESTSDPHVPNMGQVKLYIILNDKEPDPPQTDSYCGLRNKYK